MDETRTGDAAGSGPASGAAGRERDVVAQALEELRAGIRDRSRRSGGPASPGEWTRFFQTLRRRLGPLGMSERTAKVDAFGMDRDAVQRAVPMLDFLADRYWRIEIRGTENLPARSPYVLVTNAGGPVPYDGLMLAHAVSRIRPGAERPHFLVADWLVGTPFAQPLVTRLGGVRACHDNARRLLRGDHPVIAFPEGFRGSVKTFPDRYRLAPFGVESGIRAGLEAGTALVPVGIVGAEEAHPILAKDAVSGRALGLPFVPITPTFPMLGLLGLLPLPSKWVISIGEPLAVAAPGDSGRAADSRVATVTADLREQVQALVDSGLASRESVWG